jgi:hypothetical protein
MGKKGHILCILLLSFGIARSQAVRKNLVSANCLQFHNQVYVFGLQENKSALRFKCFAYNYKLELKDSTEYDLGRHSISDFLEISSDTIHNVLNFYFQLANQKNTVTLLRLNDTLGKICSVENYDANHVNSLTAFDDEKYIFKEDLYTIRINTDSAGKQFFLSRYSLKSMLQPFEYDFKWQFAFERKYIHRATVLYADSSYVMVYAHVFDGPKKGQWVLRINATNGALIKGTKLSIKGDPRYFLVSNSIYTKKTNSINLIGSIYAPESFDLNTKAFNFVNLSKNHKLFLITIDSAGEVRDRVEKLFALPLQINKGSFVSSYYVKIREFKKVNTNSFDVWADLYELYDPNTLNYYSSWHIDISPDDVDYAITPSRFYIATKAIPNFSSFAKGDLYGKFHLDDIGDYDKFKYKTLLNPVVIKTNIDDVGNSSFVLKKTTISNATKAYNYVFMGKKALENKVILRSEQGQNVNLFFIDKQRYISFITNISNSDFELKLNTL